MSKPSIPQGTRDFSPAEVRKRQYILNTLKNIFETYSFQPLETPSMEQMQTLMGKYGGEGDRLIFKILNNGLEHPSKHDKSRAALEKVLEGKNTTELTERALRYDLTIPFARYVVMHQNDLAFPFRRYQMQPVWRADRPQRGRYREFWQCDCDVVGSNSLINEAELICIYQKAFEKLGIPEITIKINSRKLLAGLAERTGTPEKMTEITIALDKLDKIGWEGVVKELQQRDLSEHGIEVVKDLISMEGNNFEKLNQLEDALKSSQTGKAGIEELRTILNYHASIASEDWRPKLEVDMSLARGLDYYTGFIAEVVTGAVKIGSLGGGGRYDDLTGLFGLKGMSGVGISFGIDRIYDVMESLNLFPEQLAAGTKVMLVNFGGENETYALSILKELRKQEIPAELYPDAVKFDKQMKYANRREIPFIILPGDEEKEKQLISLKNFKTGHQQMISLEEVIQALKFS